MLHGEGLGHVVLLADDREEFTQWNIPRLLKRAGIDPVKLHWGLIERGWLEAVQNLGAPSPVLVPLGEYALRAVLQESKIARWRGRLVAGPHGGWVLPTWKPSRLRPRKQPKDRQFRDPDIQPTPQRFTGQLLRDLRLALAVAKDGFQRAEVRYLEDPTPTEFYAWVQRTLGELSTAPWPIISADIETPYKLKSKQEDDLEESEQDSTANQTILRISFSTTPHTAVSVRWAPEYLEGIRLLLASPYAKLWWNGITFDLPVIRGLGETVHGTQYDGMDAFHVLQSDLPKGLEAVSADFTDLLPWKHLSDAEPAFYSCVDADAALRNFLGIKRQLEAQGSWDAYVQDAVELAPILSEAGRRGNCLDLQKQATLREEFTGKLAAITAEIQAVVPDGLRPRKRYKKAPKDVALALALSDTPLDLVVLQPSGRRFLRTDGPAKVGVCSVCGAVNVTKGAHLKGGKKNPCRVAGAEIQKQVATVPQWDELLPFNAGSSEQLKRYMKAFNHPLGVAKDDPERETADAKHLKALAKRYGSQHPLYGLAVQHHLLQKAISTYLWAPDAEGRVHTTYVNSPSTWRLGSRAVNLQNVGAREDGNPYAAAARAQIIASPGCKLVQADSSAIEAVFQGYFMGDANYISIATQGIHDWLCCQDLGWAFTPENIEKVRTEQKALRTRFKAIVHGTNFGMGPWLIWQNMPEHFRTQDEAAAIQNRLFDLIPKLKEYQYNIRRQAQKQSYLQSPFGHRHYFYDVFAPAKDREGNVIYLPDGRPKLKPSKDGNRVLAYLPQHSGGIFMRRNLLEMGRSKWRQYMPANVSVHDGYTLDVPEALVEEAIDYLVTLLTRPIPELGGLRVGCEVEVGDNWGKFHPEKNPGGLQSVKTVVISSQTFEPWVGFLAEAA